jgi:phosphoesterase RecJ-like protein
LNSPSAAQVDAAHEGVPDHVLGAIHAARHIALISHVSPDADAVASMGALWLVLPELGKHPHLVLPEHALSRALQYLLDYAGLRVAHAADVRECDLIVALDTAKDRRLNASEHQAALTRIPILNIDHHVTNTAFGRWNWVVEQASSTAELVYRLIRALGCQVTPTVATLLYAGMHTDTLGFALSNTSPEALQVAHDLSVAGARIPEVCERMHRSRSRAEFDLLQVVYANTRVSDSGRVAWSTISATELRATGCSGADIDNQVEVPRAIAGIAVAILFSEGDPGRVRINFRGERGVPVLDLASQFGGGGHRASAGARVSGKLDEVVTKVLAAAEKYVAGLKLRPDE